MSKENRLREILDGLLSDWADGIVDNPDHVEKQIIGLVAEKWTCCEGNPRIIAKCASCGGRNEAIDETIKNMKGEI